MRGGQTAAVWMLVLALGFTMAVPGALPAQQPKGTSVADLIAAGDVEHNARRAGTALTLYEAAIQAAPTNYDALWKAARNAVDVGEAEPNDAKRRALFERARVYAVRAVEVNPNNAEGHFQKARALGRVALTVSSRDRVSYAVDIRDASMRALTLEPKHPGALHVMGRWHAEIMRLSGVARMVAKTFMGGKVFGEASWSEAIRYLEAANTSQPNRTIHQLALGQVLRDAGQKERARAMLQAAIAAPLADPNDELYKREAERDLRNMR